MENRNAGSTAAGANDREQSYTEAPRAVKPEELKYNSDGLIPAVIQDAGTGAVLMVGYMNQESLRRTIDSGKVCFWSAAAGYGQGSSGNFFEVAGFIPLRCGYPLNQSARPRQGVTAASAATPIL